MVDWEEDNLNMGTLQLDEDLISPPVVEIQEEIEEKPEVNDFYGENLALHFSEANLRKLASDLLEDINQDIASRKPWLESIEKAKEYLGYSLEQPLKDSKKDSVRRRTYDLVLSTSLMRFYATARSELLPSTGVVGYEVNGIVTDEVTKKAELERDWLNYYLTVVDKPYYSDYEHFLLYLGFYGSVCRKVYINPLTNRPVSRFIIPEDFIINNDCSSVLESDRITHVLHLSKREILLNQKSGVYRDVDLPYFKGSQTAYSDNDNENNNFLANNDNLDVKSQTKRTLFPVYECHTYLNLEEYNDKGGDKNDNNIPLPYIVTIDSTSREILSIRRNWQQEDQEKKRINYFIHYIFAPGFGILGNGLARLIGSSSITSTQILNELIDAGVFKNFPAGLRAKGFKQQDPNILAQPGEWVEVDTGGMRLQDMFMPFPYGEPSLVLKELLLLQRDQTKELGATTEMGMLNSKEDIPTGTTLAMLEEQNRIPSAVLKSIHTSFSQELQLLSDLFRKTIDREMFFMNGEIKQISSDDFDETVKIIPVSDPSMNSTVQRMYRAESIFRLAQQAPEMHDMHEVYKMIYKAQGLSDEQIESILKPEPQPEETLPLDPVSENINMLMGQPVKSALWQDHTAHKFIHGLFAEERANDPAIQSVVSAHIKEHEAQEYVLKMQQLLGAQLPSIEELQIPEVQNMIAMDLADKLDQQISQEAAVQQPIDTNALLMADIQQKQEETISREKIAQLRAETDVFKAQLDFEKEKAKIASNEEIAQLKAETELAKAEGNVNIIQGE